MFTKEQPRNLYEGLAAVVIAGIAFWIGYGDGRGKVCDTIREALLESSRVQAVIDDEFGAQYKPEIERVCQW